MRRKIKTHRVAILSGVLCLAGLGAGCKTHLAFGTATKFGLDISQKPDQTIDVTMGYRRGEMASIPVAPSDNPEPDIFDADGTNDAYSVLGRFKVTYGDPWKSGTNDGLHLKQFFATGMAARKAALRPDMQRIFGEAAYEVKTSENAKEAR